MATPQWKIYRDGEYIGCCKHAEDAAALVSVAGGTVKLGHKLVVWAEGSEEFLAGESYDRAGDLMREREAAHYQAAAKRRDENFNRFMARA